MATVTVKAWVVLLNTTIPLHCFMCMVHLHIHSYITSSARSHLYFPFLESLLYIVFVCNLFVILN